MTKMKFKESLFKMVEAIHKYENCKIRARKTENFAHFLEMEKAENEMFKLKDEIKLQQ